MKLIILHYHLRPGGVRRIIELATPFLVAHSREPLTQVVMATGEAAPGTWHQAFANSLHPVPVEVFVEPCFRYCSEQHDPARLVVDRIRIAVQNLLEGECLALWMHNPGVGRNLLLAREAAKACARYRVPLIAHHHDWWFDNRWLRWKEIQKSGFPALSAAAKAVFPTTGQPVHAVINQADGRILGGRCGPRTAWLPNLTDRAALPSKRQMSDARRWLEDRLALKEGLFWLVPCRTLRRKNLAEALLLTRWLRPEAWLLVTGAASSEDEAPYAQALIRATATHGWRMRLGVLAGKDPRRPKVATLLGACEAVLFTSIQEGFGLPYLEAAASGRPLIARRLPNIMPDLTRFGFRFPQGYDEVLIAPELFDWGTERKRQERAFREWRALMPARARNLAADPPLLASPLPQPLAFSRLTLAAQLEVLAKPAEETWAAGLQLNPFLGTWRRRAATNSLRVPAWPIQSERWLGGDAYARRFYDAVALASRPACQPVPAADLQADFIRDRLAAKNLYPLLWPSHE